MIAAEPDVQRFDFRLVTVLNSYLFHHGLAAANIKTL